MILRLTPLAWLLLGSATALNAVSLDPLGWELVALLLVTAALCRIGGRRWRG